MYGSEEIWRGAHACLSVKWRGERAFWYTCQTHEQSTSVHPLLLRQMSPSKNTAHLFLPASVSLSLCFSHVYEHKHPNTSTHTGTDKESGAKYTTKQTYSIYSIIEPVKSLKALYFIPVDPDSVFTQNTDPFTRKKGWHCTFMQTLYTLHMFVITCALK